MKTHLLEILEIKSIAKILFKIIDEFLSHLAATKEIVIGLEVRSQNICNNVPQRNGKSERKINIYLRLIKKLHFISNFAEEDNGDTSSMDKIQKVEAKNCPY